MATKAKAQKPSTTASTEESNGNSQTPESSVDVESAQQPGEGNAAQGLPVTAPVTSPDGDGASKRKAVQPNDEEARARVAEQAALRRMKAKLKKVKTTGELWEAVDGLAQKEGREPPKRADAVQAAPPDPLDAPVMPGWPSQRKINGVMRLVNKGARGLTEFTKGTRYEDNTKAATKMLKVPAAACVVDALESGVSISPGAALALGVGVIYGPVAVLHAWELGGPLVKQLWAKMQAKAAAKK